MVYDILLSVRLPQQLGAALPTFWWEQIENLLFTGERLNYRRECHLSGGSVLAQCYEALSQLEFEQFRVRSEGQVILDRQVVPETIGKTPVWANLLPPAWEKEPVDFVLSAHWQGAGARAVVQLAYVPLGKSPLVGSLRLIWDAVPGEGDFEANLRASFAGPYELGRLSRLLSAVGEERCERLADVFVGLGELSYDGEILVFDGKPEEYREFLDGFEPEELKALPFLRLQATSGRWRVLAPTGVRYELVNGMPRMEGRFTQGSPI